MTTKTGNQQGRDDEVSFLMTEAGGGGLPDFAAEGSRLGLKQDTILRLLSIKNVILLSPIMGFAAEWRLDSGRFGKGSPLLSTCCQLRTC
jgi:hypothetical protein